MTSGLTCLCPSTSSQRLTFLSVLSLLLFIPGHWAICLAISSGDSAKRNWKCFPFWNSPHLSKECFHVGSQVPKCRRNWSLKSSSVWLIGEGIKSTTWLHARHSPWPSKNSLCDHHPGRWCQGDWKIKCLIRTYRWPWFMMVWLGIFLLTMQAFSRNYTLIFWLWYFLTLKICSIVLWTGL